MWVKWVPRLKHVLLLLFYRGTVEGARTCRSPLFLSLCFLCQCESPLVMSIFHHAHMHFLSSSHSQTHLISLFVPATSNSIHFTLLKRICWTEQNQAPLRYTLFASCGSLVLFFLPGCSLCCTCMAHSFQLHLSALHLSAINVSILTCKQGSPVFIGLPPNSKSIIFSQDN